jgi:cell division protein FtsW (lipid II flippase)
MTAAQTPMPAPVFLDDGGSRPGWRSRIGRGRRPGRSTELGLMLLAALVTVSAYILASLGKAASLPANLGPFLGLVIALLLAAHVATRYLAPRADNTLLPLAGVLNGLGYVFIVRLNHHQAGLQALWTALGMGAYVATLVLVPRVRDLDRYRYLFAFGGVGLLLLPLLPVVGENINGSRVWVHLGPINLQPGEFAKIALVIFCASYLGEKRDVLTLADRRLGPLPLPDLRALGPVAVAWGLSIIVMVAESDLGMSMLYFGLFISMLYVATGRARYVAAGVAMFAAAGWTAYKAFGHVRVRFQVWLNPWPVADHAGYQIIQALFAFGSGGVAGTGLALGHPDRIPVVQTDFIFAAVGEELGLAGTVAMLAAFMLIVGAALRIAVRSEHPIEKLIATGAGVIFALQTFIIVGGVIRLLPLTGLTLPFVSYGGSSLLANYILLALLVRISDSNAETETVPTTQGARR